jgi:hypothetical protein
MVPSAARLARADLVPKAVQRLDRTPFRKARSLDVNAVDQGAVAWSSKRT